MNDPDWDSSRHLDVGPLLKPSILLHYSIYIYIYLANIIGYIAQINQHLQYLMIYVWHSSYHWFIQLCLTSVGRKVNTRFLNWNVPVHMYCDHVSLNLRSVYTGKPFEWLDFANVLSHQKKENRQTMQTITWSPFHIQAKSANFTQTMPTHDKSHVHLLCLFISWDGPSPGCPCIAIGYMIFHDGTISNLWRPNLSVSTFIWS